MVIRKGDKGSHVVQIQKALRAAGFWPSHVPFSKNFGPTTDKYVRKYQRANGLVDDGQVGRLTLGSLGVSVVINESSKYDEKYKGVTIQGSVFPDKPIKKVKVRLNREITEEYIPAMESVMFGQPEGFKLLITIMAYKEGYRKGTRSYRTKNPGNIGNTDSGANRTNMSLSSGIELQKDYVLSIIRGEHKAYPMGSKKAIRPYFSKEIAKHTKLYGMSPYVPGYAFTFTGQLDQFVKIYSTGARAGNGYLSMIISYFKAAGYEINAQSKIQDIIKLN